MLKAITVFIISIACFSCNNHLVTNKSEKEKPTILFSNNSSPQIDSILKKEKVGKTIFINAGLHIDPENNKKVNLDHYTKFLNSVAKTRTDSRYVVLDWERLFSDLFDEDIKSQACQNAFLQLEKCIQQGKKILPDKKWGIYNLPVCHYWDHDVWKNRGERLLPLLKNVDVLYPSLYDFYKDDNKYAGKRRDELYIKQNLEVAFELNEQLGKEIFVFVWHRWHPSNAEKSLKSIDLPEFRNHIANIYSFRKNEKKVDGVVWWGSEKYFYGTKHKAILEEKKQFKDFDNFYMDIINNYLPIIIDEANKAN